MRKRVLVAFTAALAVFGLTWGLAATLNITSSTLAGGDAAVASCDSNGVTVSGWTLNTSNQVTAVEVTGIAAACDGQTLQVTLMDSLGDPIASANGSVTINDTLHSGTETVTIGGTPSAESVATVNLAIFAAA